MAPESYGSLLSPRFSTENAYNAWVQTFVCLRMVHTVLAQTASRQKSGILLQKARATIYNPNNPEDPKIKASLILDRGETGTLIGGRVYSYIHVLPDEFLFNLIQFKFDLKRNSSGRT